MEDIIYLLTKPVWNMTNPGPKILISTLPSPLKEKRGGLVRLDSDSTGYFALRYKAM
jgi:hypothetical protein